MSHYDDPWPEPPHLDSEWSTLKFAVGVLVLIGLCIAIALSGSCMVIHH